MEPGVVDVAAEIARIRAALGRPFDATSNRVGGPGAMGTLPLELEWYVVQGCLVCGVALGLRFRTTLEGTESKRWLHRELFGLYDGHSCRLGLHAGTPPERLDELFERTERESVRIAERAVVLAATEPDLAARAEREFELLVGWATELRKRS